MQAILPQPLHQEAPILTVGQQKILKAVQSSLALIAMVFSLVCFGLMPSFLTFSIASVSCFMAGISFYEFYQNLGR
jgi:hypothetical protein